jgi:hypothetical protein
MIAALVLFAAALVPSLVQADGPIPTFVGCPAGQAIQGINFVTRTLVCVTVPDTTALQSQINALQSQLAAAQGTVSSLQSEVGTLQSQIASVPIAQKLTTSISASAGATATLLDDAVFGQLKVTCDNTNNAGFGLETTLRLMFTNASNDQLVVFVHMTEAPVVPGAPPTEQFVTGVVDT